MTEKNSKPSTKKKLIESTNEFPVVGIAASAGGLSAFKELIDSIPENSGMAYVLIQHLDSSHDSQLPEILRRTAKIPVSEISNDVKVEPDHIYIIPSNKMLISNDGKLELSPRPEKGHKSRNLPIDLFFDSLGEVHQSHSIGVVLTGTGYDGTEGLRSIKEHGGITFAQNTESAEYNGMPNHALEAGVVDFVLPAAKIPQKLMEVVRSNGGRVTKEQDQKASGQANEKSEVEFKLLAETIAQLIWITDASGQFEYSNTQWNQYTGTSPDESMENKWLTFVHPEDLAPVLREWDQSLNSGDPFSMEFRLKKNDGTYNWFLAKAFPLFNADGDIIKWFGSYTNIERQKKAEEDLRRSSDHFRQLAELLPEKVTHADPQGNLNYYNQSWLDYTGFSLKELKRNGWLKIMHPEDRKEVIRRWKRAMETGEDFEMEMRCVNKDNHYKWHLNRTVPVRDERGKIKIWIGATTEIQKIKEEEKRKEGFLKLVSHELKTPVTSIKGYVQLLLSMLKDPKKIPLDSLPLEPSLERIDTQISRLTRLISEMLDLSRIEENKLELNKEELSINELVEETIQDINFTNTDHKIHIRHKYQCTIRADKDRIGQVLINFVTNAIKYSPENKDIEVIVEKARGNHVAVSIRDKGIGIAKNDQKEIFRRFHRIAGKNQETYSGLGIGLFLANEIIERHDGQIWVDSKLGEGSIFTFTLPFEPGSDICSEN